jgi:plasmid maintenance system antidote protein VapI
MLEMLRRPEGVSLDELAAALGIQPHLVRALISIHARRKMGLTVKASGRRYRIVVDE